jgi:ribA/ribD-fused uncharacterized protein
MSTNIRTYKKNECITFKSTKGKYGGLSNMAPGFPIYIGNEFIRTSEVLYQALRFPDYPKIQKELINFPSPISAKKFGRNHIEKSRIDWDVHRFKIMKFCIELKLFQNKELFTKVLLDTRDLPIVEYTETDKVWGAIEDGDSYVGINALGRLLMELREKVKTGTFELTIPRIDNLTFLSEEITIERLNSTPNTRLWA